MCTETKPCAVHVMLQLASAMGADLHGAPASGWPRFVMRLDVFTVHAELVNDGSALYRPRLVVESSAGQVSAARLFVLGDTLAALARRVNYTRAMLESEDARGWSWTRSEVDTAVQELQEWKSQTALVHSAIHNGTAGDA